MGRGKDPLCDMVVSTATALSAHRGERTYYFCSEDCRQTFLAPGQEIRRMRLRFGIALGGVLALAVLRAAAFIALATADIGIAIGSGSDVAKEAGDLLLLGNDLVAVVTAIGLSRATMRKIRQNLFWAVVYNSLGVPIAALGWLNPMIAGAAMALSSLSVIVNSSLLRRYRVS